MKTKDKKRIEWIDFSKGLFMLLVILSHTGNVPKEFSLIYKYVFLSGYFLISGFFFSSINKEYSLKNKLYKIIDSILIPYLLYWTLSFSVDALLHKNYFFLPDLLKSILEGKKLWFASALICSEVTLALILYFKRTPAIVLSTGICMLLIWKFSGLANLSKPLPWYINISLISTFFMSVGYFLSAERKKIINFIENKKTVFILGIPFFFLLIIDYFLLDYKIGFPSGNFGSLPYFVTTAIVGVGFVCSLGHYISHYASFIIYIGKYSLLFYFYQHQVILAVKKTYRILDIQMNNYILTLVITLIVTGLLFIPVFLTAKYIPILTGKKKLCQAYFSKSL